MVEVVRALENKLGMGETGPKGGGEQKGTKRCKGGDNRALALGGNTRSSNDPSFGALTSHLRFRLGCFRGMVTQHNTASVHPPFDISPIQRSLTTTASALSASIHSSALSHLRTVVPSSQTMR